MTVRDLEALDRLRGNWQALYRRELRRLSSGPPPEGSPRGWLMLICRPAERPEGQQQID